MPDLTKAGPAQRRVWLAAADPAWLWERLAGLLADPDPHVRRAARALERAAALGAADPAGPWAWLERLLTDPDRDLRLAAGALGAVALATAEPGWVGARVAGPLADPGIGERVAEWLLPRITADVGRDGLHDLIAIAPRDDQHAEVDEAPDLAVKLGAHPAGLAFAVPSIPSALTGASTFRVATPPT